MENSIVVKVFNASITLTGDDLIKAFAEGECKIDSQVNKGKFYIRITTQTETGWIGVWAKLKKRKESIEDSIFCLNSYGSSRSFYSRNGRWFLDTVVDLAMKHKGNLFLISREPDTGGGSQTVIHQGEMILGCFSKKLGSPYGFSCIWKSEFDPEKDVDKAIEMTVHDVATRKEEVIRIDPA